MNNDKNATVRNYRTTEKTEILDMILQLSDTQIIDFCLALKEIPKYSEFAVNLLREFQK